MQLFVHGPEASNTIIDDSDIAVPPKHIPGRAGGGWEDDPDPPTHLLGTGKKHSGSGGSSDLADRSDLYTN